MKIAYVCPFYTPAIDGVKQVVNELAVRLVKKGHDVHVYTSDWDKTKRIRKKEEIIDGVKVHRCFHILRTGNFVTIWPSVFFKLLKEDFDIIHSHIPAHGHSFLATLAAKIKKTKCLHTTHCPWSDAYRSFVTRILMWFSYRTIMKLMFKMVDKIIAITPWELSFIIKFGGDRKKIIIIPNGMDNILYKKIKDNKFKERLGIKGKLVLFFGRLNPTKGPDKFVLAAKKILKQRKDIWFVIRGPDEGMKEVVKKLIGNEKNIILMKETRDKKEIAEMFQAADIFVLPSYREGLPLTLFEALASGLPIVASPVNGVPFEMKDPDNGFFVKYGDIAKLKEKILEILDNKKLAQEMIKNNIEKSKRYSWDLITNQMEKVYEDLI